MYPDSDFASLKDFEDKFKMVKVVGQGGQASVWSAIDRKSKDYVAVKKFKKRNMDEKRLQNAYNERQLLASLDHQNIIKESHHFENNNYICMITELMDNDVRDMKTKMTELMTEE